MQIMTVLGPIDQSKMGLALPHEHIIVDFIGADQSGTHRYDRDEVKKIMRPYLVDIKNRGVKTFVECTPMFLARDPRIFRDLSRETGLNILTNTGQYKEPFLPKKTFEISAADLAESWIHEYENGIDGTDVRPGFIKTAVEPNSLKPTQVKVITAAAHTSKQTGLTIATHTGAAVAAFEIIEILEKTGVDPAKWIFVHAQNEDDPAALIEIARRGSWISLDGLGPQSRDRHFDSLAALIGAGYAGKIMLSHDAGWYHVGEPDGGAVRPFTYLFDEFLPYLRAQGIGDEVINQITAVNPGMAFGIG